MRPPRRRRVLLIKAVVALVVARHVQSGRIIAVMHGGALAVKRMPRAVDRCVITYAVDLQQVHPAVGLCEVALAERHFPYAVVDMQPRTRGKYKLLAVAVNGVGQLFARFLEADAVAPVGRADTQNFSTKTQWRDYGE